MTSTVQIIARIEWDAVSGVTGIIGAIVAVGSMIMLFQKERRAEQSIPASAGTILHYLVFCSAWVLLVIAFDWIADSFGPIVTEKEERVLYGVMMGLPALMLANYALRRLGVRPGQEKNPHN